MGGPARKLHIPLGFQGPTEAQDTARDAVLFETASLSPGRAHSKPNSTKKKNNSSPGAPVDVPSSVFVTALWPEGTHLRVGLGKLTPFPSGGSETNTSMCLRFGQSLASERIFRSLRTHDPCSTAVSLGTPFSPLLVPKVSLGIFYYPQDLHRWRSRGSRPAL
ncbi:hypothetical protein JTE90_020005 [Oedothorax gibbosus]|uniref:Uncharacterized protein n=1 Tax=Oedothorax gibbosus TaxID=931172 RepID=A0AAV6TFG0_9ARAC|nr:hypothetical protein JTE90_020005 [Oedothorax gibbosus]